MGSKTGIGIATGIPFINKRKGGSGVQPLPPDLLDVLVGVWIADQNNNDSSNRDIIKNKIPNAGGDFELLNFAYKLNSGYGKYEIDFDTWIKSNKITSTNSESFNFTTDATWTLLYYKSDIGKDMPSFKVHIKLEGEGKVYYNYVNSEGVFVNDIITQEEYVTPISYNTKYTGETPVNCGFTIGFISNKCSGTITQIPSFQGALVTDGVNDLITSSKTVQEMLGGSNEITVVSMIHQIELNSTHGRGFTNCIVATNSTTSFVRTQSKAAGKTGIYGYTYNGATQLLINNILGDKNDYEKLLANASNVLSDSEFYVASSKASTNTFSKVAWYWTFIAKRVLTNDEINQVIAYYNLDKYVKPDIYYDVKKQGLSNDTPDADWYLKDHSGNGRDMQLYNYGKTPESGINEEGGLQSDGVTDYGKFVGDLGIKDYTVAVDRAYLSFKGNEVPIVSNIRINTTTPFLFEFADNTGIVRPYSFGATTVLSPMELSRKISYQSTYIYNGNTINKGTIVDTGSGLTIGRFGGDQQYSNFALWSFLLFPYSLSEFLLERQLKRYKLGTLYPDMIEWRPIVKSNIQYKQIDYFIRRDGIYVRLNPGDYFSSNEDIIIRLTPIRDWQLDVVSSIKINGKDEVINVSVYTQTNPIHIDKSPQKIDITIDEYIRYEDVVQPYPYIIKIRSNDGYFYTYGDKLKVGSEIIRGKVITLFPELYSVANGIFLNGQRVTNSEGTLVVSKNMVFSHGGYTYLKANEPNCIADPQRLRIPNSSYKILGYIPDISGHGNHLKINNSAYAGMSGANGYIEPFNDRKWNIGSSVDKINRTDNKITVASLKKNKSIIYVSTGTFINEIKVVATGIPVGGELIFHQDTGITIPNNVVVTVGGKTSTGSWGFIVNDLTLDWSNLVIQQIGEYEGSFCLDGVDDFITIPTLSHGAKQVLMKVNWNSINTIAYDHRNGVGTNDRFAIYLSDTNGAIAYNARNSGQTYIDGILNTNIVASQLKDITHNITITNNDVNASNSGILRIGSAYTNSLYTQMALFSFMSFDDISSEDEIKELNDIVGIEGGYVESPDYYWDAYGKANRATQDIDYLDLNQASNTNQVLIDKSKAGLAALELYHNTENVTELNNRKLVANNFAFNEESGYGGWLGVEDLTTALNYRGDTTTNNWKRGGTFLKDRNRNDNRGCGYAYAAWFDKANYILKFKVKITGLTDADELYICQYNIIDPEIKQQLFNGINEVILDLSASIEPTYQYISFRYPPLTNDVDFEFLYEYPNGLVSDGVDDHLINTVIPAFTDFTVIAKRISKADIDGTMFVIKGKDGTITNAAFGLEYKNVNSNYTYSFGASTKIESIPNLITWCTPTNYNGQVLTKGNVLDANGIQIGKFASRYWKGVFYKTMLYSKTIDMLSINMLKNLFNQDILIDVKHPIFKNENSTSQST